MANRSASQFTYSMHKALWIIDTQILIGSSGAVTSFQDALAIKSVTRFSAGIYQVVLNDNYYKFLRGFGSFVSPVTGGALNVDLSDAALTIGVVYQIVTLGTSTNADWLALGVPSGITPAVGVAFKALAVGIGVGTGTVKAIGVSGIGPIEFMGTPALTSGPTGVGNQGAIVLFQCLQPQQTGTTTNNTPVRMTPADPTSGSTIQLMFLLSNSSAV